MIYIDYIKERKFRWTDITKFIKKIIISVKLIFISTTPLRVLLNIDIFAPLSKH